MTLTRKAYAAFEDYTLCKVYGWRPTLYIPGMQRELLIGGLYPVAPVCPCCRFAITFVFVICTANDPGEYYYVYLSPSRAF